MAAAISESGIMAKIGVSYHQHHQNKRWRSGINGASSASYQRRMA